MLNTGNNPLNFTDTAAGYIILVVSVAAILVF